MIKSLKFYFYPNTSHHEKKRISEISIAEWMEITIRGDPFVGMAKAEFLSGRHKT